jgi:hypothetical protein
MYVTWLLWSDSLALGSLAWYFFFLLIGVYTLAPTYIIVALFLTFHSQPPSVYQNVV